MGRFGGKSGAAFKAGAAAHRRPAAWVIVPAIVIVGVLATAGTYALAHATSSARGAAGAQSAALAGQAASTAPLRVLSVSPAPGARRVDGGNPVVVTFSAPLAAGSPMPSLKPAVRGRRGQWRPDGRRRDARQAGHGRLPHQGVVRQAAE